MKRYLILLVVGILVSGSLYAQSPLGKGGKQLNAGFGFSNWGVPVYAGLDFGVHDDITIGPRLSYRNYGYNFSGSRYTQSLTVFSFNGNYHFDRVFSLPSEWNFYAGLTLGYYFWGDVDAGGRSSAAALDLQIGGRYFISDNFGFNLEFGGSRGTGGGIFGITVKF